MTFGTVLNQLLDDIPAAKGVIILDWEGEAVAQAARISEYDMKVIGAHCGIIVQHLKEMLLQTGTGCFEEIIFRFKNEKTVVAPLADDYLLLVQLGCDAVLALAANKVRHCALELRQEFIY